MTTADDARKEFLLHEAIRSLQAEWVYNRDCEDELAFAPYPNGRDDEYWVPIHDAIKDNIGAPDKDLWAEHAFIARWGTEKELRTRLEALEPLVAWWVDRENELESEILKGLETAQQRLSDLCDLAARMEYTLGLRGCAFNPTSRLLVEVEPAKRGPKRTLLSQAATDTFDELVTKYGRAAKNTKAIRSEIRARLSDKFDPDLLDPAPGGKVHSAINSHLNADRARIKKRRRNTGSADSTGDE